MHLRDEEPLLLQGASQPAQSPGPLVERDAAAAAWELTQAPPAYLASALPRVVLAVAQRRALPAVEHSVSAKKMAEQRPAPRGALRPEPERDWERKASAARRQERQ